LRFCPEIFHLTFIHYYQRFVYFVNWRIGV
jgi:hypothetical protein